MAKIRRNDLRSGLPAPGSAAPGTVDINQWTDKDFRADIGRFIVRYGRVGSRDMTRACSEETISARRARLASAMQTLVDAKLAKTLSEFRPHLMPRLLKLWDEGGLSPSSQIQAFSVLKWFWLIHGITRNVRNIKAHAVDPDRYYRTAAAQRDKGVSARVEDMADIFKALDDREVRVGAWARLGWALGLRKKECIRLKPYDDLKGMTLHLERGTKGGRPREICLATADEQRRTLALDAIDSLCRLTKPGWHAGWPTCTLEQSQWRMERHMRAAGLTRAQIGATFHGLRHDYTNDTMEILSGIVSPVRGGYCVDYRALQKHQAVVSKQLGHNRLDITNAYYGSWRAMDRMTKKRIGRSWDAIHPGLGDALEILQRYKLQQLYLTGLRAQGANQDDKAQFDFAVPGAGGLEPSDIVALMQQLTAHWRQVLNAPVYVSIMLDDVDPTEGAQSEAAARMRMPLFSTGGQPRDAATTAPTPGGSAEGKPPAQMAL
jgi:integrase